MSKDKIKWTECRVKLGELKPWLSNPKFSTKSQAQRILKSFERFGQAEPINISPSNAVYNGHQRLSALLTIHGAEHEIAAWRSNIEFTEEQKQDFTITMHAGAVGSFNWDALASWDATQLQDWGMDADYLKMLNSDANNVKEMLRALEPVTVDAEAQVDRAAELNEKWKVKSGDLWQIGEHKLLCGDCTVRENVERLMGGEKADMMFTDPPYGVNYTGGHFHSGNVNIKREREKLISDTDTDIYSRFLPIARQFVRGACYMWFAGTKARQVYDAVEDCGFEIHAMIVWHKINATYAAMNAQYKQRHEPCLYFKPNKSTLCWIGRSDECTVWEEKRDASNELHPTQKPVVLAKRAIANHEVKTVVDFFAGSGSTIIAAQNLNRRCYAMEISDNYCAVILERMITAFPDLDIHRID